MHGDPQGMAGDGERRTQVVVAITLVMMVVEITTGRIAESVALLADGTLCEPRPGWLAKV